VQALCRDLIESVQKENGTSIAFKTGIKLAPQSAFARSAIAQSHPTDART
jgi:hypothetical protein